MSVVEDFQMMTDKHTQTMCGMFRQLVTELETKNRELSTYLNTQSEELARTESELENVRTEHNALQEKFKMMKQLFS